MDDATLPSNPRFIDLTGKSFSRLRVLAFADTRRGNARWWCECSCGVRLLVIGSLLRAGKTRSCGCLQRESVVMRNTTHGKTTTPEYWVWAGMKARCADPKHRAYPDYGGRGITVCVRWRGSFEAFLADMGPRPTGAHTIERIDNDGLYSPENCRWATRAEQALNRSDGHFVEYRGERRTVAEWAQRRGIRFNTLLMRLRRGWSAERALETHAG